jgi:sulfite reductase beta subunit-like hemoprotein
MVGCRYGVGDSVGLAVQLENRYRGVRSPHKFKGGVSGCVRECAEAQSKDFGVIATDKGWNSKARFPMVLFLLIVAIVFVGGNGGANPVSVTCSFISHYQRAEPLILLSAMPSFSPRTFRRQGLSGSSTDSWLIIL